MSIAGYRLTSYEHSSLIAHLQRESESGGLSDTLYCLMVDMERYEREMRKAAVVDSIESESSRPQVSSPAPESYPSTSMRAERIAPEGSDSGTDKDSEEPTERVPTLLESTTKRKRSEPEDHDKEPPSSSTGVESSHDRYGKERRPKKRANLYGNASDCSIEPVRFSEVYQTYRKLRLKKAIGDKGAEGEPETELMVIDSPLTEIESVSTQSENEESEDLGRLALDEEHQGDEDIIEDKVHKKSLSLDVKRTLLANLPPYSMPEHLSNEFLGNSMVRKYLRWGFAVPTQSSEFTVTFLDGSDVAGFSAQYESNPDLPKEPGQHGIWVHEFERPKVDNQEVVVFIGNKKGQWNYRGHYLRGPSAQMSTESWNKQSDTFRHTWISDLLRLDRDSCCRFRAETYLRIEKKDITPASLKEQMDYDKCMRQSLRENNRAFGHPVELSWAIREIETGVSFGMVNGVLSRGDMKLHTTVLTCVRYEEAFQQLLIDTSREWDPDESSHRWEIRPEVAEIKKNLQKEKRRKSKVKRA